MRCIDGGHSIWGLALAAGCQALEFGALEQRGIGGAGTHLVQNPYLDVSRRQRPKHQHDEQGEASSPNAAAAAIVHRQSTTQLVRERIQSQCSRDYQCEWGKQVEPVDLESCQRTGVAPQPRQPQAGSHYHEEDRCGGTQRGNKCAISKTGCGKAQDCGRNHDPVVEHDVAHIGVLPGHGGAKRYGLQGPVRPVGLCRVEEAGPDCRRFHHCPGEGKQGDDEHGPAG